jgi:hypothetical protein
LTAAGAVTLTAMLVSREFTWAHYFGSDWLLLVHRGNVLVQVITDRRYPECDWHDMYYGTPEPARGLLRNAVSGLDWNAPRLQETFGSALGTWWEVRLPLWVVTLIMLLVPLRSALRRRRIAHASPRSIGSEDLSPEVSTARRPWTRRGRILGIGSLSLTLVIGALWVPSMWRSMARFDGERVFQVDRGTFVVRIPSETEVFIRWDQHPGWESYWRATPEASWGFPHTNEMFQSSIGGWSEIILPLWTVFGLSAAPGVVLLWRHRRRRLPGFCRRCGYNLTGNVSGICPECGTPIPVRLPPQATEAGRM